MTIARSIEQYKGNMIGVLQAEVNLKYVWEVVSDIKAGKAGYAYAVTRSGDLIAVMSAGAYGAVQAGTYNTRPLVPEVLVREGEWALVRPRLTVDQLIALDRLPKWL